MKTGEIILFSAMAALTVALVLTAERVDDDEAEVTRSPPPIIEEVF